MTTGNIQIGDPFGMSYWHRKSWVGSDGKYDINGNEKWNDYSMTFISESDQLGQTANKVSAGCSNVPPGFVTWDPADDFRLQSKLVDKIRGHKFNLGVNIAQGSKLVQMCSTTIQKFGRALWSLKRGDFANAARQLGVSKRKSKLNSKDVSGRWLELQYGWLPSIGDAFEAAKAFEALSTGRTNRFKVVVRKERAYEASCSPTLYSCPGYSLAIKRIIVELSEEISFGRSLGLTDPLSVAWEIIPFSFVFDWFLPIGDYLDNLAIVPSLKGRFLTTTLLKKNAAFSHHLPGGLAYKGTRRAFRYVSVVRSVSSSLTTQRPQFVSIPDAMSGKRIANAVSLAHQLIAG